MQGMISIVTPCYNTGKYIGRLLGSILQQDYPKIEMIVVDDGSTDNTKEVVKCYTNRFKAKGYQLKYFYQNNQGQSYALNTGLAHASGEFFAWPDSDDYIEDESFYSKAVDMFRSGDENISLVRCLPAMVSEDSRFVRYHKWKYCHEDLFDDCLLVQGF